MQIHSAEKEARFAAAFNRPEVLRAAQENLERVISDALRASCVFAMRPLEGYKPRKDGGHGLYAVVGGLEKYLNLNLFKTLEVRATGSHLGGPADHMFITFDAYYEHWNGGSNGFSVCAVEMDADGQLVDSHIYLRDAEAQD